MKNASLTVVGSGIKFLSHLTTEAKVYIKQSDKVLYSINEPAMREWICKNSRNAESLDDVYSKYSLRTQCYKAMTNIILENLSLNKHICVVFYGHPSVFAKPALDAVIEAKNRGYYAKILPAVSAEDCLFADLLIDPGSCGCQSFEATDFLIHQRQFNSNSHLILWQVGIIGAVGHPTSHINTIGAGLLLDYLTSQYPLEHDVFLYEAAQYPSFEPKINKFHLQHLTNANFSALSTLYIPPLSKSPCDKKMLDKLDIKINDLKN